MTATLERPEIDEHDLQHLDFEISCDVKPCEQRADWWLVCLGCGSHTPICEPHRREKVLIADSMGPSGIVLCPACRTGIRGRSWRQLFAFVPIGRP